MTQRFSENCPRETCICTFHRDYTKISKERLDKAAALAVEIEAEIAAAEEEAER